MGLRLVNFLQMAAESGDEYYGDVSLLLHGNGFDESTDIIDNSLNNFTVTAYGDAQVDTAIKKYGSGSIMFDGNGDYLLVDDNDAFEVVSDDFTIELWAYPNSVSGVCDLILKRVHMGYTPYSIVLSDDDVVSYCSGGSNWDVQMTASNTLTAGAWHHIALVRDGSTFRLFVDGIQGATDTYSGSMVSNSGKLVIGRTGESTSSRYYDGYIDDLRFTKGVARYTSNFTPPDKQFLHI